MPSPRLSAFAPPSSPCGIPAAAVTPAEVLTTTVAASRGEAFPPLLSVQLQWPSSPDIRAKTSRAFRFWNVSIMNCMACLMRRLPCSVSLPCSSSSSNTSSSCFHPCWHLPLVRVTPFVLPSQSSFFPMPMDHLGLDKSSRLTVPLSIRWSSRPGEP